jgi:uncharacterized protein
MSLWMDAYQAWFLTLPIVLISAIAQSMTGFGFAVLAVPLLALVWPLPDAIAMSMLLSTVCVALTWRRTRRQAGLPIVRSLFIAALAGIPIGLLALQSLDARALQLIVGATTLAAAAIFGFAALRNPPPSVSKTPSFSWTVATGIVAGILTGSLSMPGPPVVLLLTATGILKSTSRATLTAFAILVYPVGLIAITAQNLVSFPTAVTTLGQIPPVVVGTWLGDKMHALVSERAFSVFTLFLLVLAALMCVAKPI